MSLLRNPSFESAQVEPWTPRNLPGDVHHSIEGAPYALSGSHCLRFYVDNAGASMGQDIQVTPSASMQSVSAFAYVSSKFGAVSGQLAIWQLDTNEVITTKFTCPASGEWQLVAATKDVTGGPNRPVRIELYVFTTLQSLFVDSVTAF